VSSFFLQYFKASDKVSIPGKSFIVWEFFSDIVKAMKRPEKLFWAFDIVVIFYTLKIIVVFFVIVWHDYLCRVLA